MFSNFRSAGIVKAMKLAAERDFLRRHARAARWVAAVVAVVALVSFMASKLAAPVHGRKIAADLPAKARKVSQQAAASGQLVNDFFTLSYSGSYQLQDSNPKIPAGLEYYRTLLRHSSLGSSVVNISLKAAQDGMSGDSSYDLRLQHPETYRLQTVTFASEPVVIASRADTGEAVAFWQHGSQLATISLNEVLTSPGDDTANVQALKKLLAGWQWK